MKRAIHFAGTYRIILVLVLAIIGGLVGVYGIQARPNFLRTEISTEKHGEISPDDPKVIDPVGSKFSTVAYPRIAIFYPAAGAKDVILDIEDPITADFVQPTKDFFIRFDIDPPAKVTCQNNPETLPPKPQVWDKNFSVRIEQAKAYTQPSILEGKYIDINLSAQILSIFEDGKLLDSYLVSTGKRGKETPRGTHAIANKCPRAWSKKYGVFMPYWMAITPGGSFGIHELPEWPGGDKEGADDLGIPVSHGCARLGIGPAERVYHWAEIGTPVVVY